MDKPVRRRLTRMSQLIAERRICALCGRAFALVKCEWAGLILTLHVFDAPHGPSIHGK